MTFLGPLTRQRPSPAFTSTPPSAAPVSESDGARNSRPALPCLRLFGWKSLDVRGPDRPGFQSRLWSRWAVESCPSPQNQARGPAEGDGEDEPGVALCEWAVLCGENARAPDASRRCLGQAEAAFSFPICALEVLFLHLKPPPTQP